MTEQLKLELELWHTRGMLALATQQLAQYQAREAEAQVKRLTKAIEEQQETAVA